MKTSKVVLSGLALYCVASWEVLVVQCDSYCRSTEGKILACQQKGPPVDLYKNSKIPLTVTEFIDQDLVVQHMATCLSKCGGLDEFGEAYRGCEAGCIPSEDLLEWRDHLLYEFALKMKSTIKNKFGLYGAEDEDQDMIEKNSFEKQVQQWEAELRKFGKKLIKCKNSAFLSLQIDHNGKVQDVDDRKGAVDLRYMRLLVSKHYMFSPEQLQDCDYIPKKLSTAKTGRRNLSGGDVPEFNKHFDVQNRRRAFSDNTELGVVFESSPDLESSRSSRTAHHSSSSRSAVHGSRKDSSSPKEAKQSAHPNRKSFGRFFG